MHPVKIAHAAVHEHHALQKEGELAGFLAVLMDDPPDVVVEVGSDAGGTLWAWQQLGARRVIGVSLPGAGFSSGVALDTSAEVVHGDSHDPATFDKLEALLGGDEVDLLFIDGDHTYDGVYRDYRMYSPLVRTPNARIEGGVTADGRPGGIVAFHDICNHPGMPNVAVDIFWRQLQFPERDVKQEIVTDPPTWGGIGWFYSGLPVRFGPDETPEPEHEHVWRVDTDAAGRWRICTECDLRQPLQSPPCESAWHVTSPRDPFCSKCGASGPQEWEVDA